MKSYDDTLTDPTDRAVCEVHDRVQPCRECALETQDEQADWAEDR